MKIWRPTEPDDIRSLLDSWRVETTASYHEWDLEDPDVKHALHHYSRVWEIDAQVVALIGIQPVWLGVGTAWTSLTHEALEHPVGLLRGCRSWLEFGMQNLHLHRVQASARVDLPEASKMLEWLGFQREGRLRHYGPDRADHWLYARIPT